MNTLKPSELVEIQRWRYAVKVFDAAKKIPKDRWEALSESLVLSPSSYGLQPWKFLVIEDADLRQSLREASWKQSQVTDASHYVVFLGRTEITEADLDRFLARTAEVQGVAVEKLAGYRSVMMRDLVEGPRSAVIHEWVSRQVYIALGNLMTSAATLGIDTCPMEGLDPAKYDEILGLAGSGYSTRVACAVGYRSSGDRYAGLPKVRYPAGDVIRAL